MLLLVLLVSLLATSTAAASGGTGSDRVGTYPAWLAAIVTSCAFVVTVIIFARDRKDRVREQANAVYAWQDQHRGRVAVSVTNGSQLPVWNVSVEPRRGRSTIADKPVTEGAPKIKPQDSSEWVWELDPKVAEALEQAPRLRFTDSAGRGWIRVGEKVQREQGLSTLEKLKDWTSWLPNRAKRVTFGKRQRPTQ